MCLNVSTAANPVGESTALYRLLGNNNSPCILFQVDAVLTVKYITKLKEQDVSIRLQRHYFTVQQFTKRPPFISRKSLFSSQMI